MINREKVLIEQIKNASEAYYTTGKSNLSNKEFDSLVEELEKMNPNSEILKKREIHGNDWNYKLENLPTKLYSIKKVKTWKEIENWIDFVCNKIKLSIKDKGNIELILTPKYDGIKLLYYNNNFYTRYETGEQGYNVTNRISRSIPYFKDENIGTEGELIISKSNFKKYFQGRGYNSSRNLIPAIFSSKTKLDNQDKVEYIRYSMYGEFSKLDKEEQILHCNSLNRIKVPYLKIYYKDLTENIISDFYFNNLSDFEYDGVVIDINQEVLRCELGETQKYLDCCRAYKGDNLFDDIKESKIENITWQMSRYGKLTPVAQITPIILNEGLVTNVSLYNAAYIRDNNIFIGQRVKVTRKGKINPKIVEFIDNKYNKKEIIQSLPKVCPFCGENIVWNESNIDLVCDNDSCKERNIQKLYFFFKTIGIKNFGLKSVRAFVKKGFDYYDFFDKEKILNINIEGIGLKIKKDFIDELDKVRKSIEIEKLQEASGLFEGISQSTLKILNTLNIDMEFYFNDRYYNEIYKKGLNLNGIGELTLKDYFDGLYNFYIKGYFNKNIKPYFNLKKKENIKKGKENKQIFKDKNICFTGFRNADWTKIIEENGGKFLSSVTSVCNLLVVKDLNSTSSKIEKAKQMGIQIISIEDFQNLININ